MRGIGVIEDGQAFREAELDRGTPRFWWSAARKAAFASALARRRGEAAAAAVAVGVFADAPETGEEAAKDSDGAAEGDGGGSQ